MTLERLLLDYRRQQQDVLRALIAENAALQQTLACGIWVHDAANVTTCRICGTRKSQRHALMCPLH